MKHPWIALSLTLLSLATFRAESAPDDLDPHFGTGGQIVFGEGLYFEFPRVKLVLLQDGDILFTNHYALWRVSANAERADPLDIQFVCAEVPPQQCAFSIDALARQPDGKPIIAFAMGRVGALWTMVGVARLNGDGSPDRLFGKAGVAVVTTAPPVFSFTPLGIAVQADGGLVVAGNSGFRTLMLTRFLAAGEPDRTFGDGGLLRFDQFNPTAFVHTANGNLVFASVRVLPNDQVETLLMRLLPNGQVDATFDARGALAGAFLQPRALAEQADGKLIVAGEFATVQDPEASMLALMRLDAQGRRDTSFGSNGMVVLPLDADRRVEGAAVGLDSQNRIVVAVTAHPFRPNIYKGARIAVARFLPDGAVDTLFAGGGLTTLQTPDELRSSAVAVTPSDGILIGGDHYLHGSPPWPDPMLLRLQGGEGFVSRPVREERAIEFYHAGFGHYVIAATQREIATLDDPLYDLSRAWRRTGRSFRVWSGDAPHLSPVCRFSSGQSFAPKSSHFYTPYAEECASLRAGSTWTFEGEPFRLQLPTATPAGLGCPAGSIPLYRAYNNGLGGAPNHRYTDDPAILAGMLDQGWAFEGYIQTKVFACIPPP
jgi:uncharacterized delta-60 repeat protein